MRESLLVIALLFGSVPLRAEAQAGSSNEAEAVETSSAAAQPVPMIPEPSFETDEPAAAPKADAVPAPEKPAEAPAPAAETPPVPETTNLLATTPAESSPRD